MDDFDMPQPLRPPSKLGNDQLSVTQGPNIILERPELAAQIGNIVANWTLVENSLLDLYAMLMGDYVKVPTEILADPTWNYTPPHHPVARQVFEQVQSFRARIELVEALTKWRTTTEASAYFSKVLKPEIGKAYASRNSIAHDGWGVCDEHIDALILIPIHGHKIIYKLKDFEDISQRILLARANLGAYFYEQYQDRVLKQARF